MRNKETFLNMPDLCQRFGITRRTLYRWIADDALQFPASSIVNKRKYFSLTSIERWEAQRAGFDPDLPTTVGRMEVLSPVITDYKQFVAALTKRRGELKLSCMELDMIAGMQEGYSNKLENYDRPNGRGLGKDAFPLWLGGLRVGIVLVDLPRRPYRLKDKGGLVDLSATEMPSDQFFQAICD